MGSLKCWPVILRFCESRKPRRQAAAWLQSVELGEKPYCKHLTWLLEQATRKLGFSKVFVRIMSLRYPIVAFSTDLSGLANTPDSVGIACHSKYELLIVYVI